MIAHLQRASHTAGLLTCLYGPGERGDHRNPRVVEGDCHGAPIEMFARPDALRYLAHSLDAPVERLGPRAPQQPVWFCSVRSAPHRPDLTDAQWAEVARRLVSAAGVAPVGDPDACRWIAVRNQPRSVHVVATLAREDGGVHHSYRDAFHLQTECHRIAAEVGHLPSAPSPTPAIQEPPVPILVTITAEPSGSVVARGGDNLAGSLLSHAGFAFTRDWHGPRHRLPTSMPRAEQAAIVTHAAEMLRAARYEVELDPALDVGGPSAANPLGRYVASGEVVRLTDRIKTAENGAELREVVDHLLHPEHGVLERVREALEAAGEQVTDLDVEAYGLADRFGFASEFLTAAQGELLNTNDDLSRVGSAPQGQSEVLPRRDGPAVQAALATSPAAEKATTSSTPSAPSPPAGATVAAPQASRSGTR